MAVLSGTFTYPTQTLDSGVFGQLTPGDRVSMGIVTGPPGDDGSGLQASTTGAVVSPEGQYWPSSGGPEGAPGGLSARATASKTTASLAANATETGTITLASGYRILRVATSVPARVRLYYSTATRTADAARAVGTDPTGDHGVQFDFATTAGDLDWGLSPTVDGYVDSGSAVPYSITNLSGATGAVTVTLTWLQTEA